MAETMRKIVRTMILYILSGICKMLKEKGKEIQ